MDIGARSPQGLDKPTPMGRNAVMADKHLSLEERISQLESQVQDLSLQVAELRHAPGADSGALSTSTAASLEPEPEESFVPAEELLTWVGTSSLLPRISAICFILVVALVLRTVTDNGLLGKELGSILGMVYATALIGWGWRGYGRKSSLAPVFASFGALLMFSIVWETHAHFGALSSPIAYLLLIATGCTMSALSFFFSAALPIQIGTLGLCLTGVAVDFPNPVFSHLAALLLVANILGFLAFRAQRCSWLRWLVFGVTLAMLQVWVFKLGRIPALQGDPARLLTPSLFLPAVTLFAFCFLAMALVGLLRRSAAPKSKLDFCLPTLYPLWAFAAAEQFFQATGHNHLFSLGAVGTAIALAFLGIAFRLTGKATADPSAKISFILAASVLLPVSLPAVFGNMQAALPPLSLAALALAPAAQRWRSGEVRVMSYLLQLYACGVLIYLLCGMGLPAPLSTTMMVAGAVSAVAWAHYLWCRSHPPFAEAGFFSRFDPQDHGAALLFSGALICCFYFLRTGLFLALGPTSNPDAMVVFRCSQSIIINVSAAILMVFAYTHRNKEWRNIAILMTIIGAGNVFLADLIRTHGFPLVASVFTFGVAAALESLTLSRWHRQSIPEEVENKENAADEQSLVSSLGS